MGISSYLSKFALGITPEGLLSPPYGGTGTTTGAGSGGGNSPTITSITYIGDDTATNTAGGGIVTINGTNFNTGVTVLVGDVQVSQVTRVSATQITFLAPANAAGNYILYVVNTDGGVAISVSGIQYSGVPSWTTTPGSLGTPYSSVSFTATVAATGDAPISYSVVSGALPSGINLNTSTGVISGTTPIVTSSTNYSFTVRATDGQNQDTDRTFSITVLPVTFLVTPAANNINEGSSLTFNVTGDGIPNGTYYWTVNTNVGDFATSSGSFTIALNSGSFTVTPTTDTTTEGPETFTVSIRSDSISGTVLATSSSITINDTSITPVVAGQAVYTTPSTYQWTAPAGVTSVCVVCVGGGGGGNESAVVLPGDDEQYYWSGGGGALAWKNNITVIPGQSYEVIVGAGGNNSTYLNYNTGTAGGFSSFGSGQMGQVVKAGGGGISTSTGYNSLGAPGGAVIAGDGGGAGGRGGNYGGYYAGGVNPGGGGAGGYSGAGGNGATGGAASYNSAPSGSAGSGGGGGGGGGGGRTIYPNEGTFGGAGGGVGLLGEGVSGSGGSNYSNAYMGGGGGSGGATGGSNVAPDYNYKGGAYGGGAGINSKGGDGAVRIIWGSNRAFPSTNTGNL